MAKVFLFFFISILLFTSCENEEKKLVDVSHINVDFSVKRFDIDFYNATQQTLPNLKKEYRLLFPVQTPDSIWISKMNDKDEQELFGETQKVYADFSSIKNQIENTFQHIKYYNPAFKVPNIITLLTNIDYNNRIVYADHLLLISLDAYLGKEHPFYGSYPKYIKQNNHKEHIVVDVANTIIARQIQPVKDQRFISKIIQEGKKGYLRDLYLPLISEKEKWGYTAKKLAWAKANEEQIWKYFIENQLLYSSNMELDKRFIDEGPFSKFYLSQDNLSPSRIGPWIGTQIVHAYMKNNNVSFQELLQIEASELFKNSKYKPKR